MRVDVDLSDDQQLFRDTTARFIEARCPMETVRAMADNPLLRDPGMLRDAGDLGWFALFVPEKFGGGTVSGSPLRDAVIVAEERGRRVQPGPFVATNVVAFALAEAGRKQQQEAWLPLLARGEVNASWAISDRSGLPAPGALRARTNGTDLELSGIAGLVSDAGTAGLLLATALRDSGEVVQCLVPANASGVEMARLTGLDLTREFFDVSFNDVRVPEDAVLETDDSNSLLDRLIDIAATLTVAESVGAMSRLLELTVGYAKLRTAFGRPIGSFQALKHLLADTSFSVEVSAAGLTAAGDAVDGGTLAASEVASIAKAYVGDAGVAVAQACQQTHGGIGFTWEHDLHFYLRRLAVDRVLYGDPSWHRERICRIHGL
ncbi:MAG: acyl-CoA dehydrogenase family protein [Acidimicrobiales bacterium]